MQHILCNRQQLCRNPEQSKVARLSERSKPRSLKREQQYKVPGVRKKPFRVTEENDFVAQ